MIPAMIPMIVLLVAVFWCVFWCISTVNDFKRKEIRIEASLSDVEVALTKRYDMLTKTLDTARGYMNHETELFSRVISMRRGMDIQEMNTAQQQMDSLSGRLFAVAENYPELRSSEVFVELQRGIRDTEEHLQAARRLYNANVAAYNTAIALFPEKFLAKGRTPKEFFAADPGKQNDVAMKF